MCSFDFSDSSDSSESFDFTPDFEIPNLESENLDSPSDIENNFETEDFSDVMQVKEDCDSEKKNEKVAEKKINENENEKKDTMSVYHKTFSDNYQTQT